MPMHKDVKVIDLTAWRAAHRPLAADACRWSEAVEAVAEANLRVWFAWQRNFIRFALGV